MKKKKKRSGRTAAVAAVATLGVLAAAIGAVAGYRAASAQPASASAPLSRSPDGRQLALSFDEEFDREGDLGRNWGTTYGDGRDPGTGQRTLAGNGELQLYVDRAYGQKVGAGPLDPFAVRGGKLHIRAEPTSPTVAGRLGGFRYTSGLISSQPSFSQRYGYFEMRARLPRGKGLWPAFWMLPADLSWPPEIDVMESIGDPQKVFLTVHSNVAKSDSVPYDLADDGFHTFAVSWDPRNVVWYIDGKEAARQATPADLNKPMYLIANLAVGGAWPGAPDAGTRFPADFAIDYIRAYRFADSPT